MSTHDAKQASAGEALVEELTFLGVQAGCAAFGVSFGPVEWAGLDELNRKGPLAHTRAILSYLARRGGEGLPTDADITCAILGYPRGTRVSTSPQTERARDRVRALFAPIIAAAHAVGSACVRAAIMDELAESRLGVLIERTRHAADCTEDHCKDRDAGLGVAIEMCDAIEQHIAARDAALEEARAEIERLRATMQHDAKAREAHREEMSSKLLAVIEDLGVMRARAEAALQASKESLAVAAEAVARAEEAEKRLADVRDLLRDWRGLMTSWTFGERAKKTLDYCAKQLAKSLGEDWR